MGGKPIFIVQQSAEEKEINDQNKNENVNIKLEVPLNTDIQKEIECKMLINSNNNLSNESKIKNSLEVLRPILLPSSAVWFDRNLIHQIEKESLIEFFEMKPGKQEKDYLNIRDKILDLYYQNPNSYLSATKCIKNIVI